MLKEEMALNNPTIPNLTCRVRHWRTFGFPSCFQRLLVKPYLRFSLIRLSLNVHGKLFTHHRLALPRLPLARFQGLVLQEFLGFRQSPAFPLYEVPSSSSPFALQGFVVLEFIASMGVMRNETIS